MNNLIIFTRVSLPKILDTDFVMPSFYILPTRNASLTKKPAKPVFCLPRPGLGNILFEGDLVTDNFLAVAPKFL
jgi:hypothetical protein